MDDAIELCKEKGRKGIFVPLKDFVTLTQFLIDFLKENRQVTVFELIDGAVEHFDTDTLQTKLLMVKQHLVIKGVLAVKFNPGRNQVIELSNNFRKSRIDMRSLIDQSHLRSYVKI